MTRKLYYEDCHLTSFEAKVVRCEKTDRGFEILLDATAFYPEGGGQACDLGTLGGAAVLDVQERDEEVMHLCDRALEIGAVVEGNIVTQTMTMARGSRISGALTMGAGQADKK